MVKYKSNAQNLKTPKIRVRLITLILGVFALKKLTQIGLLLALVLGFSSYSQAALLIEPVIGYSFSKAETKDETSGGVTIDGDSYKGSGGSFGGRLGYQNFGFQLGVDYLRSSIDIDDSDFDQNLAISEWAGFVGFEFPVLFRAYAGYIFSATGESKINDEKIEFTKGSGMKVGLGFTGLPFIDINFEYRKGKFGEFETVNETFDEGTSYEAFMIGLSLPLNI